MKIVYANTAIFFILLILTSGCALNNTTQHRIDFSISQNASGYNSKNAYWFARISELAYFDDVAHAHSECVSPNKDAVDAQCECPKQAKEWGMDGCDLITRGQPTNAEVIILYSKQLQIIAFRGTNSLSDLRTDITARLNSLGEHTGFSQRLASFQDELQQKMIKHSKPAQSIWLTGHSSGGAIAVLAALHLQFPKGSQLGGIYSYGAPRVVNDDVKKVFNSQYECRHFHIDHNNDPIPQLPPSSIDSYASGNVGVCLYIKPSGKLTDCSPGYALEDFPKGIYQGILDLRLGLKDILVGGHAAKYYADALAEPENSTSTPEDDARLMPPECRP